MQQLTDSQYKTPLSALEVGEPGRREQRATRVMFFLAGFATAVWAALVPFARLNTGVDDGTLGLLLLCLGGGALVAMPLTGVLTTRFGCRKVIALAILLFSLILPWLAVIPNTALLALALLMFGIGVGTTDCAMNVQAILVEKAAGKAMMSGFHGFYSIGGIIGAGAMSGMMSLGLSPLAACLLSVITVMVLLLTHLSGLLTYANPSEGPAFAIPRGAVLMLGLICFAVFLAEGAVLDWSAVFLIEHRGMAEAQGALGFACFAAAMTLGRLTGDRVVTTLGSQPVVMLGAGLAVAGLILVVWVPYWSAALLGYALIGLGCSNIVPIMFSAIGRQTSMSQAAAVPAVTTLGYLGILAGPASIGFIAQHSSLSSAFLVVAALLTLVGLSAKAVKV
ncbi:major facilitator superfamily MFS_1 [Dickeya chrysanthemi Ech1591]|uniref:Major facilitator superfamily MFS_1 n=1 Tax=Dickeya chrysanthemi (strain Ech1591) TaxID=561229 RepID=C6CGR2_DICC1|nr:MFS transporter [Dickeya chrysanthemi]ACT06727.1 major facilitator superfamily MFS_1 [Dickeya chrysanthemi Ech1591]